MAESHSPEDPRSDADSEFKRVLGNLARMPHKPHRIGERKRDPSSPDQDKSKRR